MKKQRNKYSTDGLVEAEFEPGSHGQVMKNILKMKSKRVIDQKEAEALLAAERWSIGYFSKTHRFVETDIRKIHRVFLGKIYSWAGVYRNVNLTKGVFPFAAAREIPHLMSDFFDDILGEYTPCLFTDRKKIIEAVSIVHTELLLIHPFREGNGRIARLLANLMVLQADLPPMDFGFIKGGIKEKYYRAIQQGLKRNYEPIKKIMRVALKRGLSGV
jgi:cell filamentation protein